MVGCRAVLSAFGWTSTGRTDDVNELAGVDEGDGDELVLPSEGMWNDLGRALLVVLLLLGVVVVPWAWASDGSGGAATRWLCTGMGCLLSRLTGLGDSCWPCGCELEDDDGFEDLADVEGLFPIFLVRPVPGLSFLLHRVAGAKRGGRR